jgi:hypothetical protein
LTSPHPSPQGEGEETEEVDFFIFRAKTSNTMQNNYKYFLPTILLCLCTMLAWAQTPQLNFTLTSNESGATKSYVARDFILLGSGFKYTASTGLKFTGRIDKTIDYKLLYSQHFGTSGPFYFHR